MKLKLVKSRNEALIVALIRNECRRYLTGNRNEIKVGEQLNFFRDMPPNLHLYIASNSRRPVGYAVLRFEGKECLLTGCIAEYARGCGYGIELFWRLRRIALRKNCIPILNVLKTNKRAIRLYLKLGFKIYEQTSKLLYMRYVKNPTA